MSINQSLEKKKYQPLEDALKGQSETVKNRVYSLIVHWRIEPENEFFIIFIAMGQLLALVEEAPKRFDHSFNNFTDGINLWTDSNIKILDEIARKAITNERLAGGAEKLAETSQQLVQVCSELIIQLKGSNGMGNSYQPQSLTSEENYGILLKLINEKLARIEALISNQPKIQEKTKVIQDLIPENRTLTWGIRFTTLGLILITAISSWLMLKSVSKIDQKTDWMLEKFIRQECSQGIKSPESIECKSLPN